jgi:CMP-N-acetylneuraminic acid synthetase
MYKILGITLARGGSKGVPGKNIAMINDKPMLAYSIEEALKSDYISRYVVSSDDEEILEVAKAYGADPIKRPSHLAQDGTPSWDALYDALLQCEEQLGDTYDIIADIRCTNPLKTINDIDGAISKLIRTRADSVVGVSECTHPYLIKQLFKDRIIDFGGPEPESYTRQDYSPQAYIRNGSIYISKRAAFMEHIYIKASEETRPWIMPPERSVNVNTELDLLLVEALIRRRDA